MEKTTKAAAPRHQVAWFGSDFGYQLLYQIKTSIVQTFINNDIENAYYLVRQEYSKVKGYIENRAKKDSKGDDWFRGKFTQIETCIYDPANFANSLHADKQLSRNLGTAKHILIELIEVLDYYESVCNLNIAMVQKSDPNNAMQQYGH